LFELERYLEGGPGQLTGRAAPFPRIEYAVTLCLYPHLSTPDRLEMTFVGNIKNAVEHFPHVDMPVKPFFMLMQTPLDFIEERLSGRNYSMACLITDWPVSQFCFPVASRLSPA
jgi:hypothetical protein